MAQHEPEQRGAAGTKALLESEERYRLFVETMQEGFGEIDLGLRIVSTNRRCAEMFGYTPDEIIGLQMVEDLTFPTDREGILEQMKRRRQGEVGAYEQRFRRKDGEAIWLIVSGTPIKDESGAVRGSFAMMTDITERKRAEEALRESEEKHRILFESSHDAIMTLHPPSWKFTTGNPATINMFKAKNEAEFISCEPWKLSPERQPDGRASAEKAREMIATAMRKGSHFFEWKHKRIGGEEFPATVLLSRVEQNDNVYLQATVRDITELKRVEEALRQARDELEQRVEERTKELRESEEQFRTLAALAPVGIYLASPDGNCLYANPAWCKMAGLSLEEALGPGWVKGLHPDDRAGVFASWRKMVESQSQWGREYRFQAPDGAVTSVYGVAAPQVDASGRIVRYVGVNMDITERKRSEEALLNAKDAAETANRAKSAFLAIMSHELRTPMNAIMGYTRLALQSELTPEQRHYMDIVQSRSKDLLALLSDILDLSKIEADRMELIPEPLSVEQLVSDIIQMMTLPAHDKKLSLDKLIAPQLPAVVYGDVQRLRQVLVNLVGNAVKFTNRGGIHISVVEEEEGVFRVRGSGGNNLEHQKQNTEHCPSVLLRFSVRDTGIGIPTDKIHEIFQPFTQADVAHARKYGGTGLGLAIVKRLVAMMGGKVWAESTPGKGSTFHFTARLSLHPIPGMELKKPLPVERPPARRGLRVLVVEDDETSGLLAVQILKDEGHESSLVSTGQEALDALTRSDFDLVLMDVMMPGMDGLEATRQIRSPASGVRNHAVPIVAMTANAMKDDEATCLQAGMNAYLAKPINPSSLQAVMDTVMLRVKEL